MESADVALEDAPALDVTASTVNVPVDPLVTSPTVPAVDVAILPDDPAPVVDEVVTVATPPGEEEAPLPERVDVS